MLWKASAGAVAQNLGLMRMACFLQFELIFPLWSCARTFPFSRYYVAFPSALRAALIFSLVYKISYTFLIEQLNISPKTGFFFGWYSFYNVIPISKCAQILNFRGTVYALESQGS